VDESISGHDGSAAQPEPQDDLPLGGRHRIARRFLDLSTQDRVLEVGCARGEFTRAYLIGKVRHVRAVDISREGIEYAKARDGNEYYSCCSSNDLPFADDEFDKVLFEDTLEHVDDEKGTIAEISRVLRPGGLLVLTVPHRFFDSLDPNYPEHRHYSLQELEALLPMFRIEKVHRSAVGLGYLNGFLRKFARGRMLRRLIGHLTVYIDNANTAVNWGFGFMIAITAVNTKAGTAGVD